MAGEPQDLLPGSSDGWRSLPPLAGDWRTESDQVSVRVNVLALTLPVVLVTRSINSRSGGSPVSRESVRILDVHVQDAGHVSLRMLVVGEVHGEVAEVSKCVSLIVVLGPEPQSLVVLDRSRNIDHPEDRLVADDPNRPT